MMEKMKSDHSYVSPVFEKTGQDGTGIAGFTVVDVHGSISNQIKPLTPETRDLVMRELSELRSRHILNEQRKDKEKNR